MGARTTAGKYTRTELDWMYYFSLPNEDWDGDQQVCPGFMMNLLGVSEYQWGVGKKKAEGKVSSLRASSEEARVPRNTHKARMEHAKAWPLNYADRCGERAPGRQSGGVATDLCPFSGGARPPPS
jgi:hypothetical protein